MVIEFTEEEKKYIDIAWENDEYTFYCKSDAPRGIKKTIENKIGAHKKWLGRRWEGARENARRQVDV